MKTQRSRKPNDPDYIDIFADDEDTGTPVSVGSLFDEDDGESVSPAPKKKKSALSGLFSAKKKGAKPSRAAAEEDLEEEEEEDERPASRKDHNKPGLFSRRKKAEPEEDDYEIEEEEEEEHSPAPTPNEKRGLFSRGKSKEDFEDEELEDDHSYLDDGGLDEDEFDEDELGEGDLDEEEDDKKASDKGGRSSLFTWRERDEDEAPPPEPAYAEEEASDADSDADSERKHFSFNTLFKGGKKEKEAEEGSASEEKAPETPEKKRRTPVYTAPAVNSDEDWDIGGDFSDPFAEPENESETEPAEAPLPEEEADEAPAEEKRAREFTFDRFGRRKEKPGHSHYGHRKNAKKATTTVVTNETDTRREEEEARLRAEKRDIIRDREIKKRKEERRVRILRELKQRLTVAGLLGILLVLVLLAAYFAFRITGIDVTGVCTRYTSETIVEMSGLTRGRHILLQDLSAARENLNADPYLSATVKYVFPNKININISERRGVGVVQWGPNSEYLALIDQSGFVLEADLASKGSLPLVKGLVVTRVVAGTKIGDDADEQVQSTLDVLRKLDELNLLTSISSIDMSETMGISLYTPEGYRVELGSVSDLATKLGRLQKNWKTIMSTAAEQMKKPSVDNVTIYLYAKSGVVVSPHDIGYVDETQISAAAAAVATPEPAETVAQTGENPYYTEPEATPEPVDIIPAFNNNPFTG